jgi:Zn-dependent peptidase ImmA (M78 family)
VEHSPDAAARQARHDLALGREGPVPDILRSLEHDAGVAVVVARLAEGGPAGAYTVERGRPFILLNSSEPVVRQRFTLAHEFGHHCLHHGDMLDERIAWDATDPKEAAANAFAAEFLVPVAALNLWFEAHVPATIDLGVLVRLANDFGVSCEAALWRSKAAGRVSSPDADRLKARLDSREHWGLRRDLGLGPIVDTLASIQAMPVRVPEAMVGNVLEAVKAGVVDPEVAAERLRISVQQVGVLAERRDSADG